MKRVTMTIMLLSVLLLGGYQLLAGPGPDAPMLAPCDYACSNCGAACVCGERTITSCGSCLGCGG
jgi:hypothetical protein